MRHAHRDGLDLANLAKPDPVVIRIRLVAGDLAELHGRAGPSPAAVQIHRANLPVTFPVPGGVIEVATNQYGLKRMHHVRDDGTEHVLRPHPRSQEGLRARFGQRFPARAPSSAQ